MDFYYFYNHLSPNAVYLEGEDDYLKNMALAKIKKESDVDEIDAVNLSDPTVDDVIAEISTVPFLSEKRFITVREFYPDEKGYARFISEFEKNKDYVVLALVNSKKYEPFKNGPITFINCDKSEDFARDRVAGYFNEANLSCDYDVIASIVDFCSCDMAKITAELAKLSAYCYEKGKVEMADVDLIVSKDLEYKFYELSDNVANKNYNKAYAIINDMFSKNEPPQKLFTALYNHFRKLLFCKLNKDASVIAKALSLKESAVKATMRSASKFNAVALKRINERFYEYDFAFKSGKIDPKNAIWLSIFGILFDN